MDDSLVYRINLLEILSEDFEEVPEPPEEAAEQWSVAEIKAYYESGGKQNPAKLREKFPKASSEEFNKWFPGIKISRTATTSPKGIMLCFPNAGNEESMYTNEGTGPRRARSPLLEWSRDNNWLMLAVQPPGRAMRLKEQFCKSPQDLARQLLPVVASSLLNTPYVVVAHSVGTWNAFEFLMHARDQGLPMPTKAFLSGFPGPDIPFDMRPWQQQHKLEEDLFKDECREWDINEVIFSKAMWPMYQPMLRADFTFFDQYDFAHEGSTPFGFPIVAFWGTADRRVDQEMVERWAKFTSADFTCLEIEGNHLWPLAKEPKQIWLTEIVRRLDFKQ